MPLDRRIGILGGTFDPIHCGHLDLASGAEAALGLTRLFVIPANVPPHRPQPFASSFHRFAMVALTVAERSLWRASDLELRLNAPSYTSTTLLRFHDRGYEATELFFVIGADAFVDIAAWKDYPKLLEFAHFAVVSRPGWPVKTLAAQMPQLADRMVSPARLPASPPEPAIILIDAVTADVSATAVRRARAEGRSIAGLVPPRVQKHIEQHGLYTPTVPGRRGSDQQTSPAAGRLHGQSGQAP
jgi:nicotinate-nucleotide adenylyltransferase